MPLVRRRLPLLLAALAATLSACGSLRPAETGSDPLAVPPVEAVRLNPPAAEATPGAEPLPSYGNTVAGRIWASAQDWLGVPYRFGGEDRDGIDCSAFVRTILDASFGVQLSRATATQVNEGEAVERSALRAGDLVFFKTGRRTRHVGVYLGDGTFVHASTRRGVTVDPLDDEYYDRTYWTARRVLDPTLGPPGPLADAERTPARARQEPPPTRPAPARPTTPSATPSGSRRTGW